MAVTVLILVLAVALIVVGALSDGASAVLTKAVNICTECIGLG
ncbi:MAG: thioredoxin [Clostridia bacterium]|nr:thioredoxin [Clostridia bacterium]